MVRHSSTPGNMAADDDKDKLAAPLFSSAIGICAARCGRYASEPSIFACGAGSCGCVDGALIMIWDLGSEVKYRLPHTHTVYTTIHIHYSPETANLLLLILLLSKAKPCPQPSPFPPTSTDRPVSQYPCARFWRSPARATKSSLTSFARFNWHIAIDWSLPSTILTHASNTASSSTSLPVVPSFLQHLPFALAQTPATSKKPPPLEQVTGTLLCDTLEFPQTCLGLEVHLLALPSCPS